MKKIIFYIVMLTFISTKAMAYGNFCNGYKKGFLTSYKQKKNINWYVAPPVCPMKPWKKQGDPRSDYEFGYTLGYQHGWQAR